MDKRRQYILRIFIVLLILVVTQVIPLQPQGTPLKSVCYSVCYNVCYAAVSANSAAPDAEAAILRKIAEEFAKAACQAVDDVARAQVSRKEVYRLKSGTVVSRKEIKRRGGSERWFQIYKIKKGDRVYRRIAERSYKPGGAVALGDLRYIRVLYHDFHGKVRSGEIIVSRGIADETRAVFRDLYKAKYQIRKMRLVDDYFPSDKTSAAPTWSSAAAEAADTASMNDDNTSGFNYRMVAGTSSVSMHGYGRAIDVNPFENPWCPGGTVYYNQKASASYANRVNVRPHMILAGSDITKSFKKHGFRWLGEAWTRDYQHFEK